MRFILTCLILNTGLLSCEQRLDKADKTIIYSAMVKDSFEIYVSAPAVTDSTKTYDVIYYCDANLRSGKKLRELIKKSDYATKVNKTIFIGIGHIGDYHVLRRRDFILPGITNGDTAGISKDYGQVENFYQFLKTELIPKVNKTYKTNPGNNAIVGHSLGGLFTFYCLFKNESLFKKYYALSPSLWIDNYSIYDFNKLAKEDTVKKSLYFSAGSLELLNHIKTGTDNMHIFLKSKEYANITYTYAIHKGETHNSQVEYALDYLLKN